MQYLGKNIHKQDLLVNATFNWTLIQSHFMYIIKTFAEYMLSLQ